MTEKPRRRKKAAANAKTATPRYPKAEMYTISDLNQIKVLADPLRIRLLQAFCQERTTKQVADMIGEKPTRLYHHVEALERVGLIELSRTRQKRGTLEKYYLAVARGFRAESGVFSQADEGGEKGKALQTMVSSVLDQTAEELRELIARGESKRALEEEGLLSHMEIRADEEAIRQVRKKLRDVLEELQEKCCGHAPQEGPNTRRYRLNLAFFPLDGPKS